jgi:hypothetical protein
MTPKPQTRTRPNIVLMMMLMLLLLFLVRLVIVRCVRIRVVIVCFKYNISVIYLGVEEGKPNSLEASLRLADRLGRVFPDWLRASVADDAVGPA